MAKKVSKEVQLQRSKDYVEFLEKSISSKNYKAKATAEEFAETRSKLAKERLILKLLT